MAGATYPQTFDGKSITPMQGVSLLPALNGEPLYREAPLFWQWAKGGAIRKDDMKAVFWGPDEARDWELYDLSEDLNETHDLAAERPEQLATLKRQWKKWFDEVLPE